MRIKKPRHFVAKSQVVAFAVGSADYPKTYEVLFESQGDEKYAENLLFEGGIFPVMRESIRQSNIEALAKVDPKRAVYYSYDSADFYGKDIVTRCHLVKLGELEDDNSLGSEGDVIYQLLVVTDNPSQCTATWKHYTLRLVKGISEIRDNRKVLQFRPNKAIKEAQLFIDVSDKL